MAPPAGDRGRFTSRLAGLLRRRAYPVLIGGLLVVLLAMFALAMVLDIPLLTDPTSALREAGPLAGLLGVALLTVDVFVPLPSSVVMTVHGALFGVVVGALLSLAGGVGATLLALAVGRRGQRLLDRVAPPQQRARAERLFARYGTAAVIASRPFPLVAETVAIVAGSSGMSWRRAALAGAVGNAVPAVAYAAAGSAAVGTVNGVLVLVGVLLVAGAFWFLAARGARTARTARR